MCFSLVTIEHSVEYFPPRTREKIVKLNNLVFSSSSCHVLLMHRKLSEVVEHPFVIVQVFSIDFSDLIILVQVEQAELLTIHNDYVLVRILS